MILSTYARSTPTHIAAWDYPSVYDQEAGPRLQRLGRGWAVRPVIEVEHGSDAIPDANPATSTSGRP